jgi:hypothetical protein
MKKYILLFIILSLIGIFYLLLTSGPKDDFLPAEKANFKKEDFVSLDKHSFRLNGKDFFPLAVNYLGAIQTDGKDLWPRPAIDYTTDPAHESLTKEACLEELRADMHLIKKMGFNSIRMVGMSEVAIVDDSNKFSGIAIRPYIGGGKFNYFPLSDTTNYKKFFNALSEFFQIANESGIKVMLAVRTRPEVYTTEIFLDRITKYFRNNAAIMAYDLYNEPLYFDKPERDKTEIYNVTKRWKKLCKRNAPQQLVTIGLEGIREVHAWDPLIVNVDFVSFHPYEHEPEQVRNELTWYSRYVKRPWIIGETAIPADNDSVKYETQKLFADKTLKQARDCGAWGYSWWQYKDVHWQKYHSSFMGVINWNGETQLSGDHLKVYGTMKPVAESFQKFDPWAKKDSCLCLSNYYNYSQNHDCRIRGVLLDSKNKPVEGGIILAWNHWWSHSYHTISKPDGSFELLGDFPFYHWIASANAYSMVRGDVDPDTASKASDGIPSMNIGTLHIKKLPFGN